MKKLFTHENRIIVYNLKNVLQGEGINTVIVNEYAGGGVGDLPAFDTWPELWVEDEAQLARAEAIVDKIIRGEPAHDWFCQGCGEKNDGAFQSCWNCGRGCE